MLTWIFFFFIAFGAKVVLAAAMCYLIFPAERTCDECDADTLPVRMSAPGRVLSRVTRGRLRKRWCPRCGWQGITRTGRLTTEDVVPSGAHAAR